MSLLNGEYHSGKKWDGDGVPLKDSNCAGIGTDEDKASRKAAANTEQAWVGAGLEPGINVWRIEKFKVVARPKEEYGQFYSGDSYIVLHTVKDEESDKLHRTIHFWLGEKTSIDEMGTAAYKTVELDDFFDGDPTQVREVQGYESTAFKQLFPNLQYLEGGVESGFRHVVAGVFCAKLFQVRKTNSDGVRVKEVTCERKSLNQGDCFILDLGKKLYVWHGNEASPIEKVASNNAAENMEAKRDGHAETTLDIDDAFWEALGGGTEEIAPASAADDNIPDVDHGEGVLFKISDATGKLVTTEVGRGELGVNLLETDEVMMLDTFAEIFMWIGKGASEDEVRNALPTAAAYLRTNERPLHTPIHIFKEGKPILNEHWNRIMSKDKIAPARMGGSSPLSEIKKHTIVNADNTEKDQAAKQKLILEEDQKVGFMSYADLTNALVWHEKAGLDPTKREQHLSDAEFKDVFQMTKEEFNKLPEWKKKSHKQKHNLW